MVKVRDQFEDSIIGDVRRARANLLERFGNDLHSLVRHLMAEQRKHPGGVVNLRKEKEHAARPTGR